MHEVDNSLSAARARIATAYDPTVFEAAGMRLTETLSQHFRRVEGRDAKVLNWAEPEKMVSHARHCLDHPRIPLPDGDETASGMNSWASPISGYLAILARTCLDNGQNLHHPHYVGHQVPAPIPLAALFDLVGSATNQVMAIYEMGPWATAVERAVLDAVGERIGFAPGQPAGLVALGGSIANLTGLLTARNVALGDAWSAGMAGRQPAPVIIAHADAHYSVVRSAGVLGIGTNQILPAALDQHRRMDANRLDESLADLRRRGVPIVAVSAAACATPIGAFDPIVEIAEVCRRHDVWLHIDAAHGGGMIFSERHRRRVAGLELADSVVCDAHKMMFVPALCAMLFYRDREQRTAAFHQDAPYLFDPAAPHLAEYDSGIVNLECTKRAAAFGVWGIWSLFGPQIFADMVDVTIETARELYGLLSAADDFEALHEPECNIVAFRYLPPEVRNAPAERIDQLQWQLRRAVIESGQFYLVQSRIDGRPVLRTTIMNPLTTGDDLRDLLECLRTFGRQLVTEVTSPKLRNPEF